jgi:hypothetical protein
MSYSPLYIRKPETGLVQSRQEFLLPDDAYPVLENAYVWRERIKRRQGLALLGRLRRLFTAVSIGNSGASPWTFNIYSTMVPPIVPEANAQIQPGSVVITLGAIVFTDTGNGTLTSPTPGNSGVINYLTGDVTLTHTAGAGVATTITVAYFPNLPVMGLRSRELNSINVEQLIAFDTKYAYRYIGGWQEFIPGTTWTGSDSDFFWSTNYWVGNGNQKIFWVTNFSGTAGDPIRYTNGTAWIDFAPAVDAAAPSPNLLNQCLALLPFRGRLLAFNTLEGANLATSIAYTNRIRWAEIGNPFTTVSAIVTPVVPTAWRDDIRGKGGFLDIPTSESIVAVGFVRDNLVIYCERSTWQLRYTGRSIAPFQIEKVNSELGSESTFSAVQFDTSLVGIGDKGVVECDSFKSERIDIKIPDLVFEFKNSNDGTKRVHGIRDFQQRLAYWTYVYNPGDFPNGKFPNRRLIYNYENDSWAIFTDSLTTLGTFQSPVARTWASCEFPWSSANFPWLDIPSQFPSIVGGNQQGYVMYLSSNLEPKVSNDVTLYIKNITGFGTTNSDPPIIIESPNHNLVTGQVIQILGIPSTDPFASLNGQIGAVIVDQNSSPLDTFKLMKYASVTQAFTLPVLHASGTFHGGGQLAIRDGFSIISKKFNFLDKGENIQMGYLDVLMDNTESGTISMNIYLDYNDSTPINILPENINPVTQQPDSFFNTIVNTYSAGGIQSLKNWQRVFCPVRGNFLTIQWTLSNEQLTTIAQESDVQIDAQILWVRPAGKQLVNI